MKDYDFWLSYRLPGTTQLQGLTERKRCCATTNHFLLVAFNAQLSADIKFTVPVLI
jgi:hypothetical protein